VQRQAAGCRKRQGRYQRDGRGGEGLKADGDQREQHQRHDERPRIAAREQAPAAGAQW
jgi:hypothetical protein